MYNEDRNFRQISAPVNVGDELDVKIEAVGEKGDGIAKKEGFKMPTNKENLRTNNNNIKRLPDKKKITLAYKWILS